MGKKCSCAVCVLYHHLNKVGLVVFVIYPLEDGYKGLLKSVGDLQ